MCVRALTLTLRYRVGTGVALGKRVGTEHRDQSCWTRRGRGTEHSPCRSCCAGGLVPPWLGLCLYPLHNALCISTHHPAPRRSPPPSLPPPQYQAPWERGAAGAAVGHILPPPCSDLSVSSMRFADLPSCCNHVSGTRGLDAVSPAGSNLAMPGQGGEDRTGSSSCRSTLGWGTGG